MDTPVPQTAMDPLPPPTYRFTVNDVYRMVDAGIIDANHRVELWDGNILLMAPFRVPGSNIHANLLRLLQTLCPPQAELRAEKPIDIADHYFGLEPGIALVDRNRKLRDRQHPGPRDIHLLVEISDTTQAYDLAKAPKYAQANIREYWIIDVPAQTVTVHRSPQDGRYQSISEQRRGDDRLTVEAFPEITFPVAGIFA